MPPLQNIEIRKNFNKLKSGFDAMHFMSRDTVVVSFLLTLCQALKIKYSPLQVAWRKLDVDSFTFPLVGRES